MQIEVTGFGTGAVSALGEASAGAVAEPHVTTRRAPVGDAAFAQIVQQYEYDRQLPLGAEVVDTQRYDGRQLPYSTDKVRFRSLNAELLT
jgi:hypothetical protein